VRLADESPSQAPTIRVLADATLAALGEFYVESVTTEDGRHFYRPAVFARSCVGVGGFTTDAMGEWTTSLTEAYDDARAARAVFY
jgi:hypothetical protein